MEKFGNLPRDITPKSYGPSATILLLHIPYIRDQCGISLIEVEPQTLMLLSKMQYYFAVTE